MVKQLHTNYSLLIALDLSQSHCQNFLIIYLKFIVKNVEIKSECEFKGLKNNKLSYGCNGCKKKNS